MEPYEQLIPDRRWSMEIKLSKKIKGLKKLCWALALLNCVFIMLVIALLLR